MALVDKTIQCSKAQWVDVFAVLEHMRPGSDFSSTVAAQVNEALGQTPIVRVNLSCGIPPDMLKSDPCALNNATCDTGADDIKFIIVTWVPLQVELIGIRVQNGCGVDVILEKFAGCLLKLKVAYIQKTGEDAVHTPPHGAVLGYGDIVWCQLMYRRFWNPCLVISEKVAETGALVGEGIYVDHTLEGNSQYLLLPAVRRRQSAGLVSPPVQSTCTLGQLNVSADMPPGISEILTVFFHGVDEPSDMLVELRSHVVRIHYPSTNEFCPRENEVVPLALCGENGVGKLRKGMLASPYDIHGARSRDDVNHGLDLRQRTLLDQMGVSLVGIVHATEPRVFNAPAMSPFDSGCWWEGPTNITTVLNAGSGLLVLQYPDFGLNCQLVWQPEIHRSLQLCPKPKKRIFEFAWCAHSELGLCDYCGSHQSHPTPI